MKSLLVRISFIMILVLSGCSTSPSGEGSMAANGARTAKSAPKRVVMAMMSEPNSLVARMNFAQISLPGVSNLEQLVNGSLSEIDGSGNVLPQFAMSIPSQDNGLWALTPDGGMTTTWKLRRGVRWHDSTPLTAADFAFAFDVDRDKEIPSRRPIWYDYVTSVSAPDPDTVTLTWNRLYVGADKAFASGALSPLPRHLLQASYDGGDKQAFLAMPYWASSYVGTGPFKLTAFDLGSSVSLAANKDYALGRPKIDEIEVRFITDINTLVSNLLSETVDMSMGRGFAVDQALLLRSQWNEGTIEWQPSSWVVAFPQFMNPASPLVTNLAFRQALMYGTDRQALIDSLEGGLSTAAHFYMSPSEPEFNDVASAAMKYEYDPRKAAQLIESLGYTKSGDTYRSASGEPLSIQVRSNGEPITQTGVVPLASMWSQMGVATQPDVLSTQRLTDREYLATYPYFRMMRQGATALSLANFHSTAVPTPESKFVGINYARYSSPELDGLIDKTMAEISYPQRIKDYRDAVAYISQNLTMMGQFYDLSFVAKSDRLTDVTAAETAYWTIHTWGVKS